MSDVFIEKTLTHARMLYTCVSHINIVITANNKYWRRERNRIIASGHGRLIYKTPRAPQIRGEGLGPPRFAIAPPPQTNDIITKYIGLYISDFQPLTSFKHYLRAWKRSRRTQCRDSGGPYSDYNIAGTKLQSITFLQR